MFSEKLIEEIIREAMEKGEFDDLPGKGNLSTSTPFATPEDVRLGYSVLKSAGCLPIEVELQKEIESPQGAPEMRRRANGNLSKEIEAKTLKLNLLTDSNRRA